MSTIDVIVVDDDPGAGEEFARLIEQETQLSVTFTTNVAKALELARENSVKVAVLDQRMGAETGTNAYAQIAQIDKRVRAIMFTGLADASEVGEALRSGYQEYVRKSDVQKLGRIVLDQYQKYQAQAASEALEKAPPKLLSRKHGFPRKSVDYFLLGLEVLDEAYVTEESWKTITSLQAGEEKELTETVSLKRTLTLETESQQKLSSDLGFKTSQLAELSFALKTEISMRLKDSHSEERSETITTKRSYRLPAEPEDPNALHVKARRFEHAPVFRRMRVSVLARCQCCGLKNVLALTIAQETGGLSTRQIDTLSDGSVRQLDTGIQR